MQAAPAALTITQRYRNQDEFTAMLTRIGVTANARRKLIDDDFTSMEMLVLNYSNDIDAFHSYLKGINKTFGNGARNSAIQFSPIIMKQLTAILYHFVQAVGCMHCIPNIMNITVEACSDLILAYDAYLKRKDSDGDDEALIKLPELKGHSNWTTYRDKFISNLGNINGAWNVSLLYVVDETDRPRITCATPLFEVELINLIDEDFFASNTTHFGPSFTEDNSKVWMLLKKSLLGHQPYHHIDEYKHARNGRGAWLALKAYYEGEDFVNKTIQENLTKLCLSLELEGCLMVPLTIWYISSGQRLTN